jgi:Holliday junction resolvase RusA-like endonuclease
MIEILNIETKLPSVNKKTCVSRNTGRYYNNEEYENFKNIIFLLCKKVKIKKPYFVKINIETHVDIDNPIKPILDAIEKAGVIENDKYIEKLHINKKRIKRNEQNKLKVCVGTI